MGMGKKHLSGMEMATFVSQALRSYQSENKRIVEKAFSKAKKRLVDELTKAGFSREDIGV